MNSATCDAPRNATTGVRIASYSAANNFISDEENTFEKRFMLIEMAQDDVDLFHRSMCEPEPKLCLPRSSESKPPSAYLSDRRQQKSSKRIGKTADASGQAVQ